MPRMTAQHPLWVNMVFSLTAFCTAASQLQESNLKITFLAGKWESGLSQGQRNKKVWRVMNCCMQSFTSFCSKPVSWLAQKHCQINCFSIQCVITHVISEQASRWPSRDYNLNQCLSWQHSTWTAGQWYNQVCPPHLAFPNHHLAEWGHLISRSALCLYTSEKAPPSVNWHEPVASVKAAADGKNR